MENPMVTQDRKWLIIFLIYADFTTKKLPDDIEKLKVTINNMLGDIITTPVDPDRARINVVMNSIKFVFNAPENVINDKSAFYRVERTPDRRKNCITYCEIIDNSEYYISNPQGAQRLQKADQLEAILRKTEKRSDEEVFLITWDHGSSFGMFRVEQPDPDADSVRVQVENDLLQYPFLKMFWDTAKNKHHKIMRSRVAHGYPAVDKTAPRAKAIDFPCPFSDRMPYPKVPEILKNCELSQALKEWFKNDGEHAEKKVGVLLMVNCWMMNLHTMYALQDSVHYLVAPQGNIDCPGYNVRDILLEINEAGQAGIEPPKLAEICVTTIDNDHSKAKAAILCPDEPDVIERFKIFAVDLSKTENGKISLDLQIGFFREILSLLIKELPSQVSEETELKFFLKYIRAACFDFSQGATFMIDIVNWVKGIQYADNRFVGHDRRLPGLLRNPINTFLKSVTGVERTAILKTSSGKKIYDSDNGNKSARLPVIGLPPTGYSIFFPIADYSDQANLKDNILSDQLLRDLPEWRHFLKFIAPEIDNIFN